MKPSLTHTRKITLEVYNEHPKVGDYCVYTHVSNLNLNLIKSPINNLIL